MNFQSFSQTKTLNSSGDTSVCFTTQQAKFLLKSYYQLNEYKEYDSLAAISLSVCDSIVKSKSIQIDYCEQISANKDTIIQFKDYQLSDCQKENKSLRAEIKKQKFLKMIGGTVSFVFGVIIGSVL